MAPCPTSITSFFKVILSSTLHAGKMKIPTKFVKDHGDELAECVSLSVPSGRSWNVRIQRETDASIWFHDGLLRLMEDNSVGIGFFLIFKYSGGPKFSLLILDSTGAEIEYNCTNASTTSDDNQIQNADIREASGHSQKDEGGDGSTECLDSSAGHLFPQEAADLSISAMSDKPTKHVSHETDNITNVCSTPPAFADPSKSASTRKRENCFVRETDDIKRSYFTRRKKQMVDRGIGAHAINVCVTPQMSDTCCETFRISNKTHDSTKDNTKTYGCGKSSLKYKDKIESDGRSTSPIECSDERTIKAENMSFPTCFKATITADNIEKHILAIPSEFARRNMAHSKLIKLLDSDDNEWIVHFICNTNYYLTEGWRYFVKDKKLMAGDVCIFERIGGKEVKLKVNIYRSAGKYPSIDVNLIIRCIKLMKD